MNTFMVATLNRWAWGEALRWIKAFNQVDWVEGLPKYPGLEDTARRHWQELEEETKTAPDEQSVVWCYLLKPSQHLMDLQDDTCSPAAAMDFVERIFAVRDFANQEWLEELGRRYLDGFASQPEESLHGWAMARKAVAQ